MATYLNLSNVDNIHAYRICVKEDKARNRLITAKQTGRSWAGVVTWIDSHIFHPNAYKPAKIIEALSIQENRVYPSNSQDLKKLKTLVEPELKNYCLKNPNAKIELVGILGKIIENPAAKKTTGPSESALSQWAALKNKKS